MGTQVLGPNTHIKVEHDFVHLKPQCWGKGGVETDRSQRLHSLAEVTSSVRDPDLKNMVGLAR